MDRGPRFSPASAPLLLTLAGIGLAIGVAACGLNRTGLELPDPAQPDASGADSFFRRGDGAGNGEGGGTATGGDTGAGAGGAAGAIDLIGSGGNGGGGSSGVGGADVIGAGGTAVGSGGQNGVGGGPAGSGGSPIAGCDAVSCANGCCAGTVCVTSRSAQQCGPGGQACQSCGACQRCSATGACEIDPNSHWAMAAASAVLSAIDPNDVAPATAWDLPGEKFGGSRPDPFCQLEMPPSSGVGVTATINDSLTPNWGGLTTPAAAMLHPAGTTLRAGDLLPGGMPWLIWVGDDDGVVSGQSVGELMCELDGPIDAAAFQAGGFTRTNLGACASVTIKLSCQP
jgi:hypothetical protein